MKIEAKTGHWDETDLEKRNANMNNVIVHNMYFLIVALTTAILNWKIITITIISMSLIIHMFIKWSYGQWQKNQKTAKNQN